jgi:hypothetical protein
LCLELGYAHPDHLLAQITSKQIEEWKAYYYVTSGEYDKKYIAPKAQLNRFRAMFPDRIKRKE